ncbi:transposase [Streptomyces chartreusis]|uniref:IS110 family transposase n=1 Tax=Streptomyces chartreusis TaxID=1969 RepID=UPI00365A4DB0
MVINARGERVLSRRILNGETELPALIAAVLALSDDVLWAVDLNHGGAALLIGFLGTHGQPVRLPSAKPFPPRTTTVAPAATCAAGSGSR